MRYKKINAIIRQNRLESTERRLQELGVSGITVTRVKGYGEYADFFNNDWMVRHAQIKDPALGFLTTVRKALHTVPASD
jgi:nitrogen regulatory protein P-II 1